MAHCWVLKHQAFPGCSGWVAVGLVPLLVGSSRLGAGPAGVGLLCESCIEDASIFIDVCASGLIVPGCVFWFFVVRAPGALLWSPCGGCGGVVGVIRVSGGVAVPAGWLVCCDVVGDKL